MSIRQGNNIIAGTITSRIDDVLSPVSNNPVRNSVITNTLEKTVDRRNITNCILEIPNDIKLTLNNHTLTLKAGSKLYYPNGTNNYDTLITTSDLVLSVGGNSWTSEPHMIFVNHDGTASSGFAINDIFSGSTAPSSLPGQWAVWYDTTNNIIKTTDNTGATWTTVPWSLPVCVAVNTSGNCESIHQIFNGFGYMGTIIYVLPGVKYLLANGRNEDSTLKSLELTTSEIKTMDAYTRSWDYILLTDAGTLQAWHKNSFLIDQYPAPAQNTWWTVYDINQNKHYRSNDGNDYGQVLCCKVGEYQKVWQDKIKLNDLKFYSTLGCADYNECSNHTVVAFQMPTNSNSYTWFRQYADGWVEMGGKTASMAWQKGGASVTINLPVKMKDTNYWVGATMQNNQNGSWHNPGCRAYPINQSQIVVGIACIASTDSQGTSSCSWEVKGMYAI